MLANQGQAQKRRRTGQRKPWKPEKKNPPSDQRLQEDEAECEQDTAEQSSSAVDRVHGHKYASFVSCSGDKSEPL